MTVIGILLVPTTHADATVETTKMIKSGIIQNLAEKKVHTTKQLKKIKKPKDNVTQPLDAAPGAAQG